MKKFIFFFCLNVCCTCLSFAQGNKPNEQQRKSITALIDQYSEAREKSDTVLLKKILAKDVDQLVSTGEWRNGVRPAVEGMLKSSGSRPGSRTLRIEKIRLLSPTSAIVDCRYEIENTDSTTRKMWSTFVVVSENNSWKISAIRNMLPAE